MAEDDLMDAVTTMGAQLAVVRELSAHFRGYLESPECSESVPRSYCDEFLAVLDSFI